MNKLFLFFLLLSFIVSAYCANPQGNLVARMNKIVEFIKQDSTTAYFVFKGDYNKICFKIDSVSGYSSCIWDIHDNDSLLKFLIDIIPLKKSDKLQWLKQWEKDRKLNYKPQQIVNSKLIKNPCSGNYQGELAFDVINDSVYSVYLNCFQNYYKGVKYYLVFNNKNEIIYKRVMTINY